MKPVDPALRDRIARAAEKRIRDWLASTSEFYAGPVGSDAWIKGLAGYITQGPGAVLPTLTEGDE